MRKIGVLSVFLILGGCLVVTSATTTSASLNSTANIITTPSVNATTSDFESTSTSADTFSHQALTNATPTENVTSTLSTSLTTEDYTTTEATFHTTASNENSTSISPTTIGTSDFTTEDNTPTGNNSFDQTTITTNETTLSTVSDDSTTLPTLNMSDTTSTITSSETSRTTSSGTTSMATNGATAEDSTTSSTESPTTSITVTSLSDNSTEDTTTFTTPLTTEITSAITSATTKISTSQTSPTTTISTTTEFDINKENNVSTENALLTLKIAVTFRECVPELDALKNITETLLEVKYCKWVSIDQDSISRCDNGTGIRENIAFNVGVLARTVVQNGIVNDTILVNINETIYDQENVLSVYVPDKAYLKDMCNSDVCQKKSIDNKGYNCQTKGNNCIFTSPCRENGNCSNDGKCNIKTEKTRYVRVCICSVDDDMYSYSGNTCESKTLSWKLWTIVAAGVGGGVIVILLFAVIIQCARRKSGSSNKKYGYGSGFDDRENLMYERGYAITDEYHRKPLSPDDDRVEQTNLQSFENRGYDHWEPSDSKETYASMDRHFQDPTFQTQITRPKLTTNKYGSDQLTPF